MNGKILITIALYLIFCLLASSLFIGCRKEKDQPDTPASSNYLDQPSETLEEIPSEPDTLEQGKPQVKPANYKYTWIDSENIPPVAIVIDDFGQIGGTLLQGFAELDRNITFAVMPGFPNSGKSAQLANVYGHEVIIHLPMQAEGNGNGYGKNFIRTSHDAETIRQIVSDAMAELPQAVGANNHMGSKATADLEVMKAVIGALHDKGLFFLDSRTTNQSRAGNAARELGADFASRDMFLDVPDVTNATLDAKLKELQKYRGRVEPVIIITHCHNQTKLDALRSFVEELKSLNIQLIPVSEAMRTMSPPA